MKVDYWGRLAALDIMSGPWAEAFSRHLGYDVVLARSTRPGEVVFGASVSLVTTSSIDRLAQDVGPVDQRQFRATMTIDTAGSRRSSRTAGTGDGCASATRRSRCAAPYPAARSSASTPSRDSSASDVLRSLGGYRRVSGEVVFGVDAVVTRPGRVEVGTAALERG